MAENGQASTYVIVLLVMFSFWNGFEYERTQEQGISMIKNGN